MLTPVPAMDSLLAINNDLTVIAGRAWLLQRRQRRGELDAALVSDDLDVIAAAAMHLRVLIPRLAAEAAARSRTS